jgi:hypothetical protein
MYYTYSFYAFSCIFPDNIDRISNFYFSFYIYSSIYTKARRRVQGNISVTRIKKQNL